MRDLRGCGSLALPVAVVPDFIAFCAKFGIYPNGVAFRGRPLDGGKNEGYFFFQYSDERVVKQIMADPSLLYDTEFMKSKEVILAI